MHNCFFNAVKLKYIYFNPSSVFLYFQMKIKCIHCVMLHDYSRSLMYTIYTKSCLLWRVSTLNIYPKSKQ